MINNKRLWCDLVTIRLSTLALVVCCWDEADGIQCLATVAAVEHQQRSIRLAVLVFWRP